MGKPSQVNELLRECGFEIEDFPESLKGNHVLLRYMADLPYQLRAEFLCALREFFRQYERLEAVRRLEMLKGFESLLREECVPKRWDQ